MTGPVYVITDPDAPLPVAQQALAAARGGAGLIQIRDKRATDAEIAGPLLHSFCPASRHSGQGWS